MAAAKKPGRTTPAKPRVSKEIELDPDKLTMGEAAEIQRATKLKLSEMFPGGEVGFELITGMLWLHMRKSNADLTFKDVASMPIEVMSNVRLTGSSVPPTKAAGSTN